MMAKITQPEASPPHSVVFSPPLSPSWLPLPFSCGTPRSVPFYPRLPSSYVPATSSAARPVRRTGVLPSPPLPFSSLTWQADDGRHENTQKVTDGGVLCKCQPLENTAQLFSFVTSSTKLVQIFSKLPRHYAYVWPSMQKPTIHRKM